MSSLTQQEASFFRQNGFLRLPTRIPDPLLARLNDTVREQIEQRAGPVNYDARGRVDALFQIYQRGGAFAEVARSDEILGPLAELIGSDVDLLLNRHNNLFVRPSGNPVVTHRDVLAWTGSFWTGSFASILVYLEEAPVEHGCTWVLPGSHRLPPFDPPAYMVHESEWFVASRLADQLVPVPMPAGGILAMDGMLIHSAGHATVPGVTRTTLNLAYQAANQVMPDDPTHRIVVSGERSLRGGAPARRSPRESQSETRA